MAALIRNSTTPAIILKSEHHLLISDYILDEVLSHTPFIMKKTGQEHAEIKSVLRNLLERIEIVPSGKILSYIREADDALRSIDPDDVPVLACALAANADAIWSDDRHFLLQKLIPVKTTEEMMK